MKSSQKTVDTIKSINWQLGAVNEDDDFHTDYPFLSVSTNSIKKNINTYHKYALLLYKGFRGRFYYSHNETERICNYLIKNKFSRISFGYYINEQINRISACFSDYLEKFAVYENFFHFSKNS